MLICAFVFAYAKCLFSHDAAHIKLLKLGICKQCSPCSNWPLRGFQARSAQFAIEPIVECYGLTSQSTIFQSRWDRTYDSWVLFEPPRGKTNNVVFDQVRHKPASTSIEKS